MNILIFYKYFDHVWQTKTKQIEWFLESGVFHKFIRFNCGMTDFFCYEIEINIFGLFVLHMHKHVYKHLGNVSSYKFEFGLLGTHTGVYIEDVNLSQLMKEYLEKTKNLK